MARVRRSRPHPLRAAMVLCLALAGMGCEPDEGGEGTLAFLPQTHVRGEIELQVGEVDGDLMFDRIVAIEVGPDGLLYLSDWGEVGLRVFDRNGTPLQTIGRQGEGPGEFRTTPRIVDWRDDAFEAWDGYRLTWFDLDGEVLSTRTAPGPVGADQGTGLISPEYALPGGRFLYYDRGPAVIDQSLALVSEDGVVLDTVHVWEARDRMDMARADRSFPQPFIQRELTLLQLREGTFVIADWHFGDEPRAEVVRRTFEGDTVFRVSLAHRPVPLRAEVVDERVEQYAQVLQGREPGLTTATARRRVRGGLYVPEQVRPATEMFDLGHGRTWIRFLHEALDFPPPADGEPPESLWLELGPGGEPRRTVELPPSFAPRAVLDTVVWGVAYDELGVNYLARVRLRD